MLSNIIAQMDAASLEVIYPAPIADGFNAPEIDEHGSTMYRINQPDALPMLMIQSRIYYTTNRNLYHKASDHITSFGIRMGFKMLCLGGRQHQSQSHS